MGKFSMMSVSKLVLVRRNNEKTFDLDELPVKISGTSRTFRKKTRIITVDIGISANTENSVNFRITVVEAFIVEGF